MSAVIGHRRDFCSIPTTDIVYVSPGTVEEFERLALPEFAIGEWRSDKIRSLCDDEGRSWESRCRSKSIGDFSPGTVTVIFQWWEYREAIAAVESAAGAPSAQQPLDEQANTPGVATGSRNCSASESVTRGSLPSLSVGVAP